MDPTNILNFIFQTAKIIKQTVQDVKGNRKQCEQLEERINAITDSLKSINNQDLERPDLWQSLDNFHRCMKECLIFLTEFKEKSLFMRVFENQDNKKQFNKLNLQLSQCATDLNLAINLKQLLASKIDENDQNTDLNRIESKIDDITQMMKHITEEPFRQCKDIGENNAQQLNSFKYHLQENIIETRDPTVTHEISEEEHGFLHIPSDDLRQVECIGYGGFTDVYRGKWLSRDQEVVIKVIRMQYCHKRIKENFINYMSMISNIRHAHILNIFGACTKPNNYAIVVEYISLGSLYDVLKRKQIQFTWSDRCSIATQMITSINYLHTLPTPILHCNIKSLNFLMTHNKNGFLVKTTDFGLAEICHETLRLPDGRLSIGSLSWKAPELLKMQQDTEASDVYALGIVLWELGTGREPYEKTDDSTISAFVLNGGQLDIPRTIPKVFATVISSAWDHDSQKRPNCQQLLSLIKDFSNTIDVNETTKVNYQNVQYTISRQGTTVAGGHQCGNATNQLWDPHALFVDDDDDQTLIIADYSNHRIVQWKNGDVTGRIVAGGNGIGNQLNQLNYPTNVLIDKETNALIICDHGNQRIVRWSRHADAKQGEILLSNIHCYGLAMDHQRYLYISDIEKDEVRRYRMRDRNGTLVAGGNGKGAGLNQLNFATYVSVDHEQSVYVSDNENHRIVKWNKGAKEGIIVAGGRQDGDTMKQLDHPNGHFVDTLGTVFVADSVNHRVMCWTQGAKQGTLVVGGQRLGNESNQLKFPWGLSFDQHGNLYVADWGNHRIQQFSLE